MSTIYPTINLVNYESTIRLTCELYSIFTYKTLMIASFQSVSEAAHAFESWNTVKDLVFLAAGDCSVPGKSLTPYKVISMIQKASKLEIFLREIEMSDLIKDYGIDVRTFEKTFQLNANYNDATSMVIRDSIEIVDGKEANIECLNCYTTGNAVLSLQIEGSGIHIKGIKLLLEGSLKANLDLQMRVEKTDGLIFDRILETINFYPIR
jgi:hypothetical protein